MCIICELLQSDKLTDEQKRRLEATKFAMYHLNAAIAEVNPVAISKTAKAHLDKAAKAANVMDAEGEDEDINTSLLRTIL